MDLSRSSLNYLSEILVQMKTLHGDIANGISSIVEVDSNKVCARPGWDEKQIHPAPYEEWIEAVAPEERNREPIQPLDLLQVSTPSTTDARMASSSFEASEHGTENLVIHSQVQEQSASKAHEQLLSILDESEKKVVPQPHQGAVPATHPLLTFNRSRAISKHLLKKYDRQYLYEKVWEMPFWLAAKAFGVKEHTLCNACLRLQIPTPPHGYWSRKEEKRRLVERPALPDMPGLVMPPKEVEASQKPAGPRTVSAIVMARYDREKLYADVWRLPMRHLAKEYGVSETTIWSRCKLLHIPTPGLSYWQRKARGLEVPERPPLEPVVVTGFTTNTENWEVRRERYNRVSVYNTPRISRRHPGGSEN